MMEQSEKNVNIWNNFYSTAPKSFNAWPDEEVIRLYRHFGCDTDNNGDLKNPDGGVTPCVLDIGCGTGRNLIFFKNEGHKIYGIDGSSAGIDTCRHFFPDGYFRVADLNNDKISGLLPDKKKKFRTVLCWGVFHYLDFKRITALLSEIYSLLKKDGLLITSFRSNRDDLCRSGEKVDEFKYRIRMDELPDAEMLFFDKNSVAELLKGYSKQYIGHRERTAIPSGRLVAHYFACGVR